MQLPAHDPPRLPRADAVVPGHLIQVVAVEFRANPAVAFGAVELGDIAHLATADAQADTVFHLLRQVAGGGWMHAQVTGGAADLLLDDSDQVFSHAGHQALSV